MIMNDHEFKIVLNDRLSDTEHILGVKAKEYMRGDDRLHNFNVASRMSGETPEDCLMGMKLKHTVAISDIVDDVRNDKLPTLDLLKEKIGDEINYLILLEAMITNRIIKKESESIG